MLIQYKIRRTKCARNDEEGRRWRNLRGKYENARESAARERVSHSPFSFCVIVRIARQPRNAPESGRERERRSISSAASIKSPNFVISPEATSGREIDRFHSVALAIFRPIRAALVGHDVTDCPSAHHHQLIVMSARACTHEKSAVRDPSARNGPNGRRLSTSFNNWRAPSSPFL